MPNAPYDLTEHRHRFSVWAAARAAQRKWKGAKVERLRRAVEASGLVSYCNKNTKVEIDKLTFDALHAEWCCQIIRHLGDNGIECTFGRAAKLVSVYLKSTVVCHDPDSSLARICHPPIDGIMLRNLASEPRGKKKWKVLRWTTLSQSEYSELIEDLRRFLGPGKPFWMLEEFWTVSDDE
jgi:hypothetical protein